MSIKQDRRLATSSIAAGTDTANKESSRQHRNCYVYALLTAISLKTKSQFSDSSHTQTWPWISK